MKYLRSLMQQSVTACKNQAKLIQQFTLSGQRIFLVGKLSFKRIA